MRWGRPAWKPQAFGARTPSARKPRPPPAPKPKPKSRRARPAYLKHAPSLQMPSTQTFATHCACTGVLLLAYTVFVFRRLAAFRVACIPDPRAYQPLPAVGMRSAVRWMPSLRYSSI